MQGIMKQSKLVIFEKATRRKMWQWFVETGQGGEAEMEQGWSTAQLPSVVSWN